MRASTATTAEGVLEHLILLFRQVVVASGGAAGCAVAGVTIDVAEGDEDLLAVARDAFQSWVSLLASQLEEVGVSSERVRNIALTAIASVEGALILCRAEGSDEPLRAVGEQLLALVRS
jgi:DNA polymerase III psi subunit